MNSKIIGVLLIAGLGCLVFAAIAPVALDQSTIDSGSHVAILDESETSVNQSTVKSFHLERNQKMTMKFFVYLNDSAPTEDQLHIIILSAKNYNVSTQNQIPTTIGSGVLVHFNYDTYTYPPTTAPSWGDGSNLAVTPGVNYIAELTGNTPSINKPVPGDFYIIIWNQDSSTPDGTTLYYDLTIQLDQLGTTLSIWFAIIGLALVAVGAVLGVLYLRKR